MLMKRLHRILALGSLCTVLIACGPYVAHVSATGTATRPSLPTVPRNETFITGDSFTIPAFNANQWSPNNDVGFGLQQGVFESLFYLNYQTGRME